MRSWNHLNCSAEFNFFLFYRRSFTNGLWDKKKKEQECPQMTLLPTCRFFPSWNNIWFVFMLYNPNKCYDLFDLKVTLCLLLQNPLYRMSLNMNLRRLRRQPPCKSSIRSTPNSLHQTYILLQQLTLLQVTYHNTMILTRRKSFWLNQMVSPVLFEEPFRISACVRLSLVTTIQTLPARGYFNWLSFFVSFGSNLKTKSSIVKSQLFHVIYWILSLNLWKSLKLTPR